jgi:hypothetical protein
MCESRSKNMLYQNSSVSAHTRKLHALNPGGIIVQKKLVHLGHLLWLPSFHAIFTYPPHWCMHKTFAPYYSWKMLRIQTPFHQDNLGWNQCGVGFRNCTTRLPVIGWFIGVHNCGSQKSKNWFWYLGESWISTISKTEKIKLGLWAIPLTINTLFFLLMFPHGFQ